MEDRIVESKIEVLATVKVEYSSDLYKIVDCLNRTLKEKDLMFGLALDEENKEKAVFTIYRT
nr:MULTISPECIES: YpmA family protein [Anoxybacillus]